MHSWTRRRSPSEIWCIRLEGGGGGGGGGGVESMKRGRRIRERITGDDDNRGCQRGEKIAQNSMSC